MWWCVARPSPRAPLSPTTLAPRSSGCSPVTEIGGRTTHREGDRGAAFRKRWRDPIAHEPEVGSLTPVVEFHLKEFLLCLERLDQLLVQPAHECHDLPVVHPKEALDLGIHHLDDHVAPLQRRRVHLANGGGADGLGREVMEPHLLERAAKVRLNQPDHLRERAWRHVALEGAEALSPWHWYCR